MAIKTFVLEYIKDKEKRHAAIEQAVKNHLEDQDAEVLYNEKGKPYIKGAQKDQFISVTTTGSVLICVLSDKPVGVDGEHLVRFGPTNKTDYIAIAERFFTEEEAEYVREGNGDPLRFVRVWVRKEAYVKLTGKGVSDFLNFSVSDGEKLLTRINGIPIKKFTISFPGSSEYLFAIAGVE